MDTADAETTADETATLMAEVASIKASAETMDCKVFFEGTEEARLKWFNEAKDEMDATREKGVLDERVGAEGWSLEIRSRGFYLRSLSCPASPRMAFRSLTTRPPRWKTSHGVPKYDCVLAETSKPTLGQKFLLRTFALPR